jgi:hypothetical protein
VFGRRFTYEALYDNYPVLKDRPQLRDFLGAGLRSGLIEVDLPGPPVTYRFQHVIAQEAAYHLLLFDQRQQLHRSIAQWYERTEQQGIVSSYPLLAHHWQLASDAPRAVGYFSKVGEATLRNGGYAEAAGFFQQALQLDAEVDGEASGESDSVRRSTWHRQLGECQLGLGKLAASKQCWPRETFGRPGGRGGDSGLPSSNAPRTAPLG